MEYQKKQKNLSDNALDQPSTFRTKNKTEVVIYRPT